MTVTPATPATPATAPPADSQAAKPHVESETNWRTKSPISTQGWERWQGRREAGADRDKWKYVVPPSLRQTPTAEKEFTTPTKKKVPFTAPSRTMRRSMEQIIQVAESSPLCPPPPVPRTKATNNTTSSPPAESEVKNDGFHTPTKAAAPEASWDLTKDYNPFWDVLSSTRESSIDFAQSPQKKYYPTPAGSRRRGEEPGSELSFDDLPRTSPSPTRRRQPATVSPKARRGSLVKGSQTAGPKQRSHSPEGLASSQTERKMKRNTSSSSSSSSATPTPTTTPCKSSSSSFSFTTSNSFASSSSSTTSTPACYSNASTPIKMRSAADFCTPPRVPKTKLNFSCVRSNTTTPAAATTANNNSNNNNNNNKDSNDNDSNDLIVEAKAKSTATAATTTNSRHFGYNWSGSPYVPRHPERSILSPKAAEFAPAAKAKPASTTATTATTANNIATAAVALTACASAATETPTSSPNVTTNTTTATATATTAATATTTTTRSSPLRVATLVSPSNSTKIATALSGTFLSTSTPLLASPTYSAQATPAQEASPPASPIESLQISLSTPTSSPQPLSLGCPAVSPLASIAIPPKAEAIATAAVTAVVSSPRAVVARAAPSSSETAVVHAPASRFSVLLTLEGLNSFLAVFVAVLCAFVIAGNH